MSLEGITCNAMQCEGAKRCLVQTDKVKQVAHSKVDRTSLQLLAKTKKG
jgi:hypothetical protein